MSPTRIAALALLDDVLARLGREPHRSLTEAYAWSLSVMQPPGSVDIEAFSILVHEHHVTMSLVGPNASVALVAVLAAERKAPKAERRALLVLGASSKLADKQDDLDFSLDILSATLNRLPAGSILLTGGASVVERLAVRSARRLGLVWVVFHGDGSREQRDGKTTAPWGQPTGKSLADDRSRAIVAAALAAQREGVWVEGLFLLDAKVTAWSETVKRADACERAGFICNRATAGAVDLESEAA
jgi:hypothetical protein